MEGLIDFFNYLVCEQLSAVNFHTYNLTIIRMMMYLICKMNVFKHGKEFVAHI